MSLSHLHRSLSSISFFSCTSIFKISGQIDFCSNVFFTIFIGNISFLFLLRRENVAWFLAFIFNQSQVFVRFLSWRIYVMLNEFGFVFSPRISLSPFTPIVRWCFAHYIDSHFLWNKNTINWLSKHLLPFFFLLLSIDYFSPSDCWLLRINNVGRTT